MRILPEELSIIKVKKNEIFCVDFDAEATFRLFKLLKEDEFFKEKHSRI